MDKDVLKMHGVYCIRNIQNGKMYIGSTINPFRIRWGCHKKRLRRGIHHSRHLQAAWNKYGENSFVFSVLEVTEADVCRKRESFYIRQYKTYNPKYGYNIADVDDCGNTVVAQATKKKLSEICKQQWADGKHSNSSKLGKPSWNKGLKCDNISIARRNMFSAVQVFKNDKLIATFRSVTDLDEWSKENEIPGIEYYHDKQNRPTVGRRTSHISSANIHRAIRTNIIYRGLKLKKTSPLPPEMGVVKWENCWNGENPNQQPSLPLTKQEGSETNS